MSLQINVEVTRTETRTFDFEDFGYYVVSFEHFDSIDEVEVVALYRNCNDYYNNRERFAEVPVSIFPGAPEHYCDWGIYSRKHIKRIYNYLLKQNKIL